MAHDLGKLSEREPEVLRLLARGYDKEPFDIMAAFHPQLPRQFPTPIRRCSRPSQLDPQPSRSANVAASCRCHRGMSSWTLSASRPCGPLPRRVRADLPLNLRALS